MRIPLARIVSMQCTFVALENNNGSWEIVQRTSNPIFPNSEVSFTIQRTPLNSADLKTAQAAAVAFAKENKQYYLDLSVMGCQFVTVMSYMNQGYLPALILPGRMMTDLVFPYEKDGAFIISASIQREYTVPFIALSPECYTPRISASL